jgi:hypothetical protein
LDDPFADIRPYRDDEVRQVLRRLLDDPEFIAAIGRLRNNRLLGWMPWVMTPLVRSALRREVAGVRDVYDMQMVIKRYMDRMIEATTTGFSVSGLETLPTGQPYLYMSNHRDIAMDPAFTNYALHRGGHDTVRIAIGDNLLTKPWVSDLMRLNKSFIVRRSARGPRQILKAYQNLSAYISHSLLEERAPVWIAQREGRAKDGCDRTEPAIIKMLAMSRDKHQDFGEFIASLRLVPVAISYELDPCDALKAAELSYKARHGSYQKAEHEDVASIGAGIAGKKGRVHVSFGIPLGAGFTTPEAVAAEVDRQVISLFCLHPTNIYAYEMLYGEYAALPDNIFLEDGDCSRAEFEARIRALPATDRDMALGIYANALVSKLSLQAES